MIATAAVLFLMFSRRARFALVLVFMRLFRPFKANNRNGNRRDDERDGGEVVRRW